MNKTTTGTTGGRPMIMGVREVVSSGHYLATQIGMDILGRGGNAADAAAGVGFALTVVKPQQNGIGGEVPTLIYSAKEAKVWAVSGHGIAPRAATLAYFKKLGLDVIPGDGLLPAVAPPVVATWIGILERFGTMRLADVLAPAVRLAREGFALYENVRKFIADSAERFRTEWPSSAKVWLKDGKVPDIGTVMLQPDWADTLDKLVKEDGRHASRTDGLRAARDLFYQGEIAERIVEFCRTTESLDASGRRHAGLLSMEDLAGVAVRFEEPAQTNYRGIDVYKCGPWTQGPVLLQALNLLEGYDLVALGHNSVAYIHTVVEAMKLAFADREFYYGDPLFADVPLARLLSKEYAAGRRGLIDPARASMELRPGGYPPVTAQSVTDVNHAFATPAAGHGDTTKLEVIDSAGNMVSATPSGGWLQSSPVIPGLGFPLGTRGQMFSLQEGHPNCLQPGKRPRTTLTPSLATRGGRPFLAFGSPGGDSQDQWALEFLLNVVDFGMPLQHAVEAPTFCSAHFPSSFYPRRAEPGVLYVEGRIPESVRNQLAARGHIIKTTGDWEGGNTLAAAIDPATNVRQAAASPRLEPAYAAGR